MGRNLKVVLEGIEVRMKQKLIEKAQKISVMMLFKE